MYIVLYGSIELLLSDGDVNHRMDYMSRGSILGMDLMLLEKEWPYAARVKSKTAHILKIDIEVLQTEMKNSSLLLDKVNTYHKDLLTGGHSDVDYICRYELTPSNHLREVIINFKK